VGRILVLRLPAIEVYVVVRRLWWVPQASSVL